MAFLGLVPSECSTGESRSLGSITKAGNSHARRVLIEAAWAYRFPAQIAREMQVRNESQPEPCARSPGERSCASANATGRFSARGLHQNKICTAIARELAGFIWDLARQVTVQA